ncbi:MAG: 2-amino-4-hydroxy-6-hydroxymethyldihydropteridine diphosphokinase [Pseudomonadota bacterium]|nr:2-amino-4-hydroxy-6-hydroxymethyldihydropteridine diphosphokinase [Pseudomonadota bacterium]
MLWQIATSWSPLAEEHFNLTTMTDVFVGIGSNVDPDAHIGSALTDLRERFGAIELSTAYRNPAVGFEGDDFVNLVVRFRTVMQLSEVLGVLHEIEIRRGKDLAAPRLASKTIDLDLLLFGNLVIENDHLVLPRPETTTAEHYVRPLSELEPDRLHPVTGGTFAELWSQLEDDAGPLTRYPLAWSPVSARTTVRPELRVDDLRLAVHLGVPDSERENLQEVSISIAVTFPNVPDACSTDEIDGTIDYGVMCRRVTALVGSRAFRTIEHLAGSCLDELSEMLTESGSELTLEVRKCHPPIPDLHGGTAFIMRTRR